MVRPISLLLEMAWAPHQEPEQRIIARLACMANVSDDFDAMTFTKAMKEPLMHDRFRDALQQTLVSLGR